MSFIHISTICFDLKCSAIKGKKAPAPTDGSSICICSLFSKVGNSLNISLQIILSV